jgi:hypothetical protein
MKNKARKFQNRQGDLWFEEVDSVPATAKKQKAAGARIILAHGEVTGHHHSVDADAADWWKEDNGDQYIFAPVKTLVEHQEHGAVVLPANKTILVRRQREYSPEAIRQVED